MEIRVALGILGLSEVPRDELKLRRVYKTRVKEAHPDNNRGEKGLDCARIQEAYKYLSNYQSVNKVPYVRLRVGDVIKEIKVQNISDYAEQLGYKYAVLLRWFEGLELSVDMGEWVYLSGEGLVLGGVGIIFENK